MAAQLGMVSSTLQALRGHVLCGDKRCKRAHVRSGACMLWIYQGSSCSLETDRMVKLALSASVGNYCHPNDVGLCGLHFKNLILNRKK